MKDQGRVGTSEKPYEHPVDAVHKAIVAHARTCSRLLEVIYHYEEPIDGNDRANIGFLSSEIEKSIAMLARMKAEGLLMDEE